MLIIAISAVHAQDFLCATDGSQQASSTNGCYLPETGVIKALIVFVQFPDDPPDPNWPPSNYQDIIVMVLSVMATFVNPYGIGVWRKVFMVTTDTSLRWRIMEWLPTLLNANFVMVFFMAFSLLLTFKYYQKVNLSQLVLYVFTFLLAMSSSRHFPVWMFVALPITSDAPYYLFEDIKNIKYAKKRLQKTMALLRMVVVVIFVIHLPSVVKSTLTLNENVFYPKQAIKYLKNQPINGEIFSTYNWGGYLVWKYPQKKVFITGQMPSWSWENPDQGKLRSAYETQEEVLKGETEYTEVFENFDINYVLWPATKRSSTKMKLEERVVNSLNIFGLKRNDFNILIKLEEDGWEKIYEDDVSVIYKKP